MRALIDTNVILDAFEYIITRNPKDFSKGIIKAVEPNEFLKIITH